MVQDVEGVEVDMSIDGRARMRLSFEGDDVAWTREGESFALKEAQAHNDDRNWSQAIKILRPILKERPDDKSAKMMTVYVPHELDKEPELLSIMEDMVSKWPDDYQVLNNAAWYYATIDDKELRKVVGDYFNIERRIGCSRQTINNHISDVAKQSGITTKIYPHSLRATAASLWGQMGMSAPTLCYVMGWDSIQTALPYVTASEESAIQEIRWRERQTRGM